jgi:hypothetical protein
MVGISLVMYVEELVYSQGLLGVIYFGIIFVANLVTVLLFLVSFFPFS